MLHSAHKPAPRAEMSTVNTHVLPKRAPSFGVRTPPHTPRVLARSNMSTFNMKHDSLNDRDIFCDTNMHGTHRKALISRPPPPASRALQSHNVSSVAT
jgi:hypothetical protein